MPALRAAGIAYWMSWSQAEWPAPGVREKAEERKKFCMSIITRADFEGAIVMGLWDVCMVTFGSEVVVVGVHGWVRSKPWWEEWSQKFEGEPIMALRWGVVGDILRLW
jgi:hypothetical protein